MVNSDRPQPDHYATLGLAPDASSREIEDAFHARVREHLQHANVTEKPIREKARQVGLAYETLRDPAKRRAYDQSRAAAAEPPAAPAAVVNAGFAAERPIMFGAPDTFEPPIEDAPAAAPEPFAPETMPEAEAGVNDEPEAEPEAEPPVAPVVAATAPTIAPEPAEPAATAPVDMRAEHEIPWDEDAAPAVTAGAAGAAGAKPSPAMYETGLAPWRERRSSGIHRGVLAAGVAVIVLGITGLLLARGGREDAAPPHATVPLAPSLSPAGAPAPVQAPAAPGAPAPAQVAQQTAPALSPAATVAANAAPPASVSAAGPSPSATTAASASAEAKPPPASSSPAAAASGTSPVAAAPPPQATSAAPAVAVPAPSPPAAPPPPAQQARSTQPFPRWLGGGIMNSDNPGGEFQGTVSVRFTVEPNGRVGDCRPVASSGNPDLDANTCALVEQRLRFSPALNAQGQPISSEVRTTYTWGRVMRRR